mmetsp:Transcript_22338/g.45358  ORF Transcript_22338/g.45358 Transcript_22338/m.45358 type:complete len:419 (+) Transcript_22338:292-1548(+)
MPFPKEQTCKTHASKSQNHKTPRDHKRAFEVDRPMKRHRLIYPHQMNVDAVDAQGDLTTSFSTTDSKPRFLIELSDDIISRILFSGFLENSPHQLLQTTSTCKRVQALANKYVVSLNAPRWKRYKQPTVDMITGILLRFNHLQEVDFSGCWNFGNPHLELLEPMRNALRVLRLKDTQITDAGIMTFFEYDKHSKLALEKKSSNRKKVEARTELSLEYLDLSIFRARNEDCLSDASLLSVAYACPHLKVLRLSGCKGITDEFLDSIPVFLRHLHTLDLSMCSITSRGCRALSHSPSLRNVNISACLGTNGEAIQDLVTGNFSVTDIGENDGQEGIQLQLMKGRHSKSKLTSIVAQFATGIKATSLKTIITHAPNLKMLDIRHYQGGNLMDSDTAKTYLRELKCKEVDVEYSTVHTSDEI